MKMTSLSKRRRSQLSEKELAKSVGGRVQLASGSLPVKSLKGDVRSDYWLFDDKTTGAESFSVSLKLWRKLRKEAWLNHRFPCISINFEERARLFVIGEEQFQVLNRALGAGSD